MNDTEETRVQQMVREIDETPIQWRISGIIIVGIAVYGVAFGHPLPSPLAPATTLSDIAGPSGIGMMIPVLLIMTWAFGLYTGYVMHNLLGVDPA